MKKKNIALLFTLLFTSLFPISIISAVMPAENLYTGNSAYYICDLEKNDILILNLTHTKIDSNFSMYLLNSRPLIDSLPTDNIVAEGLNIYYNATDELLYYVQIYLSNNGPDTFYLNVTRNGEDLQLVRYYVPQIPGFPLEILILTIGTGIGLTYAIWKRKLKNEKYGK